jgi:hypothetical protein
LAGKKTTKHQKHIAKQRKNKAARERKTARAQPICLPPPSPDVGIPDFNLDLALDLISRGDPRVWSEFLKFLGWFEQHHYVKYGKDAIKCLNRFAAAFSAAIAKEDYQAGTDDACKLIQSNHLIAHLIASSSYQTCDALLDVSIGLENNLSKLLMLQNPRCEIQIDQKRLFDMQPWLASLWFNSYPLGISSPTALIQKNLYRHFECMDERWVPTNHVVSGLYFSCTYHNPGSAPRVKKIINNAIKANRANCPMFENNPNPDSIAIVTNKWHRNHAVYKSASPLVEQLIGKKKLTLIWCGNKESMPKTTVTDYFANVLHCYFKPGGDLIMPPGLKSNDFGMVYFPDIGMSDESIWLSNCRMAPIQAVGYGHPDTTGEGNEIDYFVGGQIEEDSTDAYSETMVLLPGLAQEPAWPTAPRQDNYKDDGIVRINCVWGPDKYNHTLLSMLDEINKAVLKLDPESKHEFHLFASPGINRYAALPPFLRDVGKLLPNAEVHAQQEYFDYMVNAEMHDFTLNSFPFGCYNVLIESLYMGLPFLSLVGERFYNRAGMYLNEQIGMGENNFDTPATLIAKATELITNPDELRRQRDHLASLDLKEQLFTLKGQHFLEAVEYIQENHPFTKTKMIGDNNA